jgi:hypothetical protein
LSRHSEEALHAGASTLAQVNISDGVRLALTRAVESHSRPAAAKSQGNSQERKLQIRTRRPFKAG